MSGMDPVRRWVSMGLRALVLLVIVMMLAGFQAVQRHSALSVVAVVDQSESVRRFGAIPENLKQQGVDPSRWIYQYLSMAADKDNRHDDRAGLIEYDGKAYVSKPVLEAYDFETGGIVQPVEGTDSAAALRLAMAQFPPDTGQRIIWASDANDTASGPAYLSENGNFAGSIAGASESDVLAVAREAAAAGIKIDVLPVNYEVKREVMVEALYAPQQAREGQTAALRVVLRATEPTNGRMFVKHDGQDVMLAGADGALGWPIGEGDWTQELTESEHSSAGRWVSVKQIDLPLAYSGANRFEVVFEPDESEHDGMAVNNKAQAFTLVGGTGRVLVVNNVPGESGEILPNALRGRGIELDVVPAGALPNSLTRLQRYDAVIFQNVPADQVSIPQQRMLARYVNDLGGGFIMVGGPDSFGAGGWANSPIDDILPVTCTIPTQKVLPSGALVLVIDRSGSMGSPVGGTSKSQQEVANEAALLAISTLYPQDLVGVVAFDNSAKMIAKLQMNDDFNNVAKRVRSITPQGGTNIYTGLELAYEELARVTTDDAALKHVILLTDGHSQSSMYPRLVGKMRKAGITLSTIGVGDGHDATLLNQLARMGNGQYHPVRNPNTLPQVFIKEAKTIRKNLIKEKTFQPEVVNTGSPIMASISAVPPLRGHVLTGAKQDIRAITPMIGVEGEPIFAHWQVGLGRSAAFTSDATNRWATDWLGWDGYADFWTRTVRNIARPPASRNVDMVASLQGDTMTIRLDAAAADFGQRTSRRAADFANFLEVRGAIVTPDGETREVTLQQSGPGMYQTTVPASEAGNYIVELFITAPGGETRRVTGGASKPPGTELRQFNTNMPLLRQVANITGGRILDPNEPEPAGLFTRTEEFSTMSVRPLWQTLMIVLFVLLLLDIASRRVAWDMSATWDWTRATVTDLFGAVRPGQGRTAATLTALKSRQAATRVQATRDGAIRMAPPTQQGPAPDRQRKFEAAPDFVASRDLTDAVGAASHNTETGKTRTTPRHKLRTDKEGGTGQTTSRLLQARQRAREQMEGETNDE